MSEEIEQATAAPGEKRSTARYASLKFDARLQPCCIILWQAQARSASDLTCKCGVELRRLPSGEWVVATDD